MSAARHGDVSAFDVGRQTVVLLSHPAWVREFGGDPGVVGGPVTIEDQQSRVLAYSYRQEDVDPVRVQTILGRRVPEDVSLVGFDDLPEAAHFVPGLTTVRQDFQLLGRMAIEYITSLIDNRETAIHQRVLQPKLIVRGSTRAL